MAEYLCKKLKIVCPSCKTTITIQIPSNNKEFEDLIKMAKSFCCPTCKKDLEKNVIIMLANIQAYNQVTNKLFDAVQRTGFEIYMS